MSVLGGVDNTFAYKMLLFSMAILILFPTFISVFVQTPQEATYDEILDDYYDFTGTHAATTENVWVLTGIYTPYTGGAYGYTDDGWLYGEKIETYEPSQYKSAFLGNLAYTASLDKDEGLYKYSSTTAYDLEHSVGDLYTSVTMDVSKQSDLFFTDAQKKEQENGFFYYEYSGYRYAFQPLANYTTVDADKNEHYVVANSTSLSLIWYNYYGSSGVSGQLVISGSDSGVAYITAAQIVKSFSSITSTSKFEMVFNGVSMNVYIRLNPYALAQGYSVEECYNNGFWEIMVSSLSVDSDSITGTDYAFNVYEIWDVLIGLLTFNAEDYGLSGTMATLASLVVTVPLYAALISIGMSFYPVLIFAGVLAVIQSFSIF